jgi:hypothetical protein
MERNGKGLLTLAVAIAIECNSFCRFGSVLELSLGEENPVTRLRASPELRLLDEFSARYRLVNLSPRSPRRARSRRTHACLRSSNTP